MSAAIAETATRLYREGFERSVERTCAAVASLREPSGALVCAALQPSFIDGPLYDRISAEVALVVRGLWQVARRGARAAASGPARYLSDREPPPLPAFTRLDGFLDGQGWKLIECNPIFHGMFPDGVGANDDLRALFRALPGMQAVERVFRVRMRSALEGAYGSLTHLHAHRGKTGSPTFAFVDIASGPPPPWLSDDPAFLLKIVTYLMARGFRFLYCGANALTYAGGRLRHGDEDVHIVATGGGGMSTIHEGLGVLALGHQHPLVRALADRAVSSCDAFPMGGLLYSKELLARLYEAARRGELEPEVARAVEKVVPWTHPVRHGEASFRGERRELLELVRAHRTELVLKPATNFAGVGIHLGWECEPSDWNAKVDEAIGDGGYVVQERVRSPIESVPMLRDGQASERSVRSDLCPFVWSDGVVDGALVRTAEGDRLNISTGATQRPLFIIEGYA